MRLSLVSTLWFSTGVACLSGCADAESRQLARGEYDVTCRRGPSACYDEAHVVCPRGFDVESGRNQPGSVAIPNGYAVNEVTTYQGEIVVKCR